MTILRPFALVLLLAGCYSYRPVTRATPATGSRVSAVLTDSGTLEMARYVGPGISQVEGRVIGTDSTGVAMAVLVVRNHEGIESYWKGEKVVFPRNLITNLQERRLSTSRTALTGLGALAIAFGLAEVFNVGGLGSGGGGCQNCGGGGHQ